MKQISSHLTVLLAGLLGAIALTGCATTSTPARTEAKLLVALPDYCNTPDGMALLRDQSIIVSVPNFNDETQPPLLMKITPKNEAVPFYKFPTPYPGLPEGLNRIRPMGIVQAPDGNLYFADMQYMKDPNGKSRLWKLVVKNGQVEKMVLVATGMNVANGLTVYKDHIYITESVLVEGSQPLVSAVLRFKLDEENIQLKAPLKDDPHVIATFTSKKEQWRFGADGIEFDTWGNLFVGLFGEGQMFKIRFDRKGNVVSNTLFAEAPGQLINCDGMHRDRVNRLYVADSAANAVQIIYPDGRVETLTINDDVTDKRTGQLDQPCEALVRGNEIIVSNMDWPFPGFKNTKWQQPATLSVIKLK